MFLFKKNHVFFCVCVCRIDENIIILVKKIVLSLRKQAYSNKLNILTTKKWKLSDKNSDIFLKIRAIWPESLEGAVLDSPGCSVFHYENTPFQI